MKAKALSHEVAFKVVDSRQQGIPYKLLAHELNYAGHGDQWDESQADTAADRLRQLRDQILQSGDSLTVNTFDRHACPIIHRALDVPSNLAAEDGFWRWLAVEKFPDVIEARHAGLQKPPLPTKGITASTQPSPTTGSLSSGSEQTWSMIHSQVTHTLSQSNPLIQTFGNRASYGTAMLGAAISHERS